MIGRILCQSTLLLALASAAAWATWRWHPDRPELYLVSEKAGPDEITVADAIALQKSRPVIWLDARQRPAFEKGHIAGALLLNMYEWDDLMLPFVKRLEEADPQTTIIVYCDAQKCEASREIRERILNFGLGEFEIRVLHGGWPAWVAATAKR
jgi:rhodanese-related sulfurtransferase